MANNKAIDLNVLRFQAADYFTVREVTIDTAQKLIAELRLPSTYSQCFLADSNLHTPDAAHDAWLQIENLTYDAITRDICSGVRRSNQLFGNATINGKNCDLWLKDFAASCPPRLTEERLKKKARHNVLDLLIHEIICFRNEVSPYEELPKRSDLENEDLAQKLRRDHVAVRYCAVTGACYSSEEILEALKRYEVLQVKEAFGAWAQTITSNNLDYFMARRVPHYLTLRNNVPSL